MTLTTFLAMGGYALYVWTSYTVVLLALTVNLVMVFYQWRQIKRASLTEDCR